MRAAASRRCPTDGAAGLVDPGRRRGALALRAGRDRGGHRAPAALRRLVDAEGQARRRRAPAARGLPRGGRGDRRPPGRRAPAAAAGVHARPGPQDGRLLGHDRGRRRRLRRRPTRWTACAGSGRRRPRPGSATTGTATCCASSSRCRRRRRWCCWSGTPRPVTAAPGPATTGCARWTRPAKRRRRRCGRRCGGSTRTGSSPRTRRAACRRWRHWRRTSGCRSWWSRG